MTDLTDEQIANLPYNEGNPATAFDVIQELRRHTALVFSIGHVAQDPRLAVQLMEDATKEPGQSLLIQETRLALDLESWIAQSQTELVEDVMVAFSQAAENLEGME